MTAARQALGRGAEEQAAGWYVAHGYEVLDRNWRCRDGEIDLVLAQRRRRLIVVCEVKARRSERFGTALEAVGFHKQQRLRRLAARWLCERGREAGIRGVNVRFDVATWQDGTFSVLENAF